MDQMSQIPTPSSNASSNHQNTRTELPDELEEAMQYHELLGDIVELLKSKDSKPRSTSTPDTSKKTTPRTSFSTTTPTRKTSQISTHSIGTSNKIEANNQSFGVLIHNTNEEVSECINFLCVLIFGIMGFGVFIVLLEFVPTSNVTAALSVVGACMLLVLMFSFMSTLARNKTPLNRR